MKEWQVLDPSTYKKVDEMCGEQQTEHSFTPSYPGEGYTWWGIHKKQDLIPSWRIQVNELLYTFTLKRTCRDVYAPCSLSISEDEWTEGLYPTRSDLEHQCKLEAREDCQRLKTESQLSSVRIT